MPAGSRSRPESPDAWGRRGPRRAAPPSPQTSRAPQSWRPRPPRGGRHRRKAPRLALSTFSRVDGRVNHPTAEPQPKRTWATVMVAANQGFVTGSAQRTRVSGQDLGRGCSGVAAGPQHASEDPRTSDHRRPRGANWSRSLLAGLPAHRPAFWAAHRSSRWCSSSSHCCSGSLGASNSNTRLKPMLTSSAIRATLPSTPARV